MSSKSVQQNAAATPNFYRIICATGDNLFAVATETGADNFIVVPFESCDFFTVSVPKLGGGVGTGWDELLAVGTELNAVNNVRMFG